MIKINDPSILFPTQWREARANTMARDKKCCQFPVKGKKCRKKKLQMHHIVRKCDRPDLLFKDSNLIMLCSYHHRSISGREDIYVEKFTNIAIKNRGVK